MEIDKQLIFSDIPPFKMSKVAPFIENIVMTQLYERVRTFRILLNRIVKRETNNRLQKFRKIHRIKK
jgi:hypothetical protein